MQTEALGNLERVVEAMLANMPVITPDGIRSTIAQFRQVPTMKVDDTDAELLARELESRHNVTLRYGAALTERDYHPWLESRLKEIDFYYWARYRKLLQSKHFGNQVISTLDAETDRVLGLMEDPAKQGPWKRRGMVVGHVQSGKTANYTGLICKAADAGYKLIVVIAGVHNNLRNQTQKRIDEGFVGRDSARLLTQKEDRFIGVSKFDSRKRPVTFTNSVRDFSKTMATGVGVPLENLKEPAIFVIKKNSTTLDNLIDWLTEHNKARGSTAIDEPMLLIDDEADNASINVSYAKDAVSRINGQIRDLLKLFSRSCYVGYTATPFANIFIDPDTEDEMRGEDLFPAHFIVSLEAPSNYFGAQKIFGTLSQQVIRHIADYELNLPLKHKIDHVVPGLPDSLRAAVRTFVLGRAIRLVRGHQNAHCSMLVNASRFMSVQGQLRAGIQQFLGDLQASVRLHAGLSESKALKDPEMSALHEVWSEEYAQLEVAWKDVQRVLNDAASSIKVVEVNTKSSGSLNYDDYQESGLSVIAVGGFSLSRGLTLEGLMVSYFLRNSMMYDTLLQMGRWFGYRTGYEDLCRIWMPEQAEGWYAHISESTEELRAEFRQMAAAGATPEEFGLKVRGHPANLIVTARNKMGSSESLVVSVGLTNRFVETSALRADAKSLEQNRLAATELRTQLDAYGKPLQPRSGGYFSAGVPARVVKQFLSSFRNHDAASTISQIAPIKNYISEREVDELSEWDIFFPAVGKEPTLPSDLFGSAFPCQERTAGDDTSTDRSIPDSVLYIGNKRRVASRGVEKVGLGVELAKEAEKEFLAAEPDVVNFPDRIYRAKRVRPLLVVHLLDIWKSGERWDGKPVVAWSLSFPQSKRPDRGVQYIVTTTWMRENLRDEALDDELSSEEA